MFRRDEVKTKHNRAGSNKCHTNSSSLLLFRSKTIVALLISVGFVYFLSFLNVAVQVHELDNHAIDRTWWLEQSKIPRATATDRSSSSSSSTSALHSNSNDGASAANNKRQNYKHDGNVNQRGVVHNVPLALLPGIEKRIDIDARAREIEQVIKEQETVSKPKKEENAEPPKPKMRRPNFRANPYGHMVSPEVMLQENNKSAEQHPLRQKSIPEDQVLTAYAEFNDLSTWNSKPLPIRNVTAEDLVKTSFPRLNSCSKLPEQWPVDDYPDADPFLPWIHDVFPTDDGKFIQFVAQNKRRCHSGTTPDEVILLEHTAPQVALFQHVPLKKLKSSTKETPRYRLCSHEDADLESINTRFICRFKPSGDITFSEFNNDYEWATYQKGQHDMFNEHGGDNSQIHTSQLTFRCPVPNHLIEQVKTGESVVNDWATIFVDLITVRTPPRYGPPDRFLVPHYATSVRTPEHVLFDPQKEWGEEHVLPTIEDSGRWENIPVCKPSLMTYEPQALEGPKSSEKVKHNLVSCIWASTGYATRGNRYAINDGQRRLLEWITFNKILGFDHFYIYDNSGAFTNQSSLEPIADVFPEDITVIKWPSRVCNNNPNNVDSIGERSSQYAAETSCRLRFGSHVNWIGQFDIDEYIIPMGNYSSITPLLKKLDNEGTKIINFASWRAWPRRTHINDPEKTTFKNDKIMCNRKIECFELSVKKDTTMMEAYNCDRQKPGEKSSTMPAEKQIYKADYVKHHLIHYSTITESTNLLPLQFKKKFGSKAKKFPDPLSRFGNEVSEGLMLHSKSIARQDTAGWKQNCRKDQRGVDQCRIGFPWPEGGSNATADENGWEYNCYVNPRIDNYFAPKLKAKLKEMGFM
mmetsp:Transcript_27277/g.58812  ORF Transcript_27277/g.58812 Transcript_27277/m.58812 type:complete len:863 (-) Transcript_27277:191-2779(-)